MMREKDIHNIRMGTRLFFGVALLFLCLTTQADMLSDAEQMIRTGQGAQAYENLEPLEFKNAGDPRFDYLFGLAALEAGRPGRATLALERVLQVQPNHAAARLDLGRAYFALGDFDRARAEFDAVLSMNPPPAARATIEQHLAAMRSPTAPPMKQTQGYVEVGAGYDTNVNASTDKQIVYLPYFGLSATLDTNSFKQRDSFGSVGVGGALSRPINDRTAWFVGADLLARKYHSYDIFDSENYQLRAGLSFGEEKSQKRLSFIGQRFNRNDDQNYEVGALLGEWVHALSARTRLQWFGQYSQLRFVPTALRTNDTNQAILGASVLRSGQAHTLLVLSGFVGYEEAVNYRSDGDKKTAGIRLGRQWQYSPKVEPYIVFGAQRGHFSRRNLLFDMVRDDKLYELTLGTQHRIAADWSMRPRLSLSRQVSNVDFYDYKRFEASVSLRRDFR